MVKWEGEAVIGICDILKDRINDKIDKLRKIKEPKILLLLDEYRFADKKMYDSCVQSDQSIKIFNIVYVIQDSGKGFVLYQRDCDWIK